MDTQEIDNIFDRQQVKLLEEWKDFLRFKSISAASEFKPDCLACARWLVERLRSAGFVAELLETKTLPVVYAEFKGDPGCPEVVYYGHYDVQPVDPIDLWTTPPFEPQVREGKMYARGAQDNKGQTFYVIKALEALIHKGELKCSVRLFIEGEEETGSVGIAASLGSWRAKLKSDVLLVCDTGMMHPEVPSITMGLRGLIFLTITLSGPRTDLHSGVHGGVAPNPATALATLISTLHDKQGKIAVQGYYDGLEPVSEEDRQLANDQPLSMDDYQQLVGVPACGGEQGLSAWERRGFRPTIEINGMRSGYDGPGNKTIIPALATAKISSRLVSGQDPAKCLKLLVEHLQQNAPEGLKLEISEQGVGGKAVKTSASSPYVKLAAELLTSLGSGRLSYNWEGASIPIVANLQEYSGAQPVMVGFGLEGDNIHAPNESFGLDRLKQGFLFVAKYLSALSNVRKS